MNARARIARGGQPVRAAVSGTTAPATGKKFLDPWFARDATHYPAEIPWNPETWFDAAITRDIPADGRARIDAIYTEIAKLEKLHGSMFPINYNAAGHALLNGIQDIGTELAGHAKGFLELEAKARAAGKERIVLIGAIAGSIIGMPWIGAVLGGYYDWMEKEVIAPLIKAGGGAAGHSDWIEADYAAVSKCFTAMMRKVVVPPFGGTLNFGSLAWEEWQNVKWQKDVTCAIADRWTKYSEKTLEPVIAWMAVLAKYSRNDEVRRVIMNTSWNPQGFAGDSQVLIVAMPIAMLYGFDVHDFAVDLWNKSKGWSSRMDLTHVYDDGTVMDAGLVQWIVLTQDAFDLAADWKATGKGKAHIAIEWMADAVADFRDEVKADVKAKVTTPPKPRTLGAWALGLTAAAASWWLSAPLVVPLGIVGATWWYARRRAREVSVGGHTHTAGCGCKKKDEEEAQR